jgi:HTH domain spoOJ/parA/parB/repB family protein
MATIRPFKGIRPPKELVEKVESRPYDVLSSEEARAEAGDNEMSLYHIIKPEIDFSPETSEYDPKVYEQAARNFKKFQDKGWLVQDEKPAYYIYAQTMNGKTQYGLVVGAFVEDYLNGTIKKHELTRKDKEEDRMKHVRVNDANIEPVFFAYPDNKVLDELINKYVKNNAPEYDFIAPIDGFGHQFWVISDANDIDIITKEFAKMPALYIADGHHRSAAAALVGAEKAKNNPNHKGDEEYNYFMAVCFQASQLTILDYNRVVKDLNGLTSAQFLEKLEKNFDVQKKGKEMYHPTGLHNFSLYLDGEWYSLTAKKGTYNDADPIGVLDVDISSRLILDEILGIKDLRTDKRIDFVGGIRGLGELKERVDSGEMKMALALYPVSMQQIMDIADSGKIMPPKATWFEPKLRSGLVIHKLSD